MKRILSLMVVVFSVVVLTGCDTVYIEPDEIGLLYEDPSWTEDGDLEMVVYITNGTDEEYFVQDLIVQVSTSDKEYLISQFWDDVEITIDPDEYAEYTITFYADLFDTSKETLDAEGYEIKTVDDVSVYFEVNPVATEES